MKPLRILPALTLTFCLVISLAACGLPSVEKDNQAKQKLDQLLGDSANPPLDQNQDALEPKDNAPSGKPLAPRSNAPGAAQSDSEEEEGPLTLPFAKAFPSWLDSVPGLSQVNIDVAETSQAYEVRVPIEHPEDARDVQVNVTPHRIEISGQVHYGKPDSGFQGTSSFMKSFNPGVEVLPSKVQRQVKQNTLLVIIPKKTPGPVTLKKQNATRQNGKKQSPEAFPPETDSLEEQQISPEALRQLYQSGQQDI